MRDENRDEVEIRSRKPGEDESPDVEGHRFAGPEQPGARARGEDTEDEAGEGLRPR